MSWKTLYNLTHDLKYGLKVAERDPVSAELVFANRYFTGAQNKPRIKSGAQNKTQNKIQVTPKIAYFPYFGRTPILERPGHNPYMITTILNVIFALHMRPSVLVRHDLMSWEHLPCAQQ